MTLDRNSKRNLQWMLATASWSLADLIRFAKYTEAIPRGDATVLLSLMNQLDNLLKAEREDSQDAI